MHACTIVTCICISNLNIMAVEEILGLYMLRVVLIAHTLWQGRYMYYVDYRKSSNYSAKKNNSRHDVYNIYKN